MRCCGVKVCGIPALLAQQTSIIAANAERVLILQKGLIVRALSRAAEFVGGSA